MGKHHKSRTRHRHNDSAVYVRRRAVAVCALIAFVAAIVVSVRAAGASAVFALAPQQLREQRDAEATRAQQQQQRSTEHTGQPIPTSEEQPNSSAEPSASPSEKSEAEKKEEAAQAELQALAAPIDEAQRREILAKAEQTAQNTGKTPVQMHYCVARRGDVKDVQGFANTVFRSLNDPRGWPRTGVTFVQSDGSNCQMTLTLAAPQELPKFSPGCSAEYSCRVGNDVIINQKRWNESVEAWLASGATLAQYRTMVINHEVGHRLGHIDNERTCEGAGKPAPLMQEQSMKLLGCTPNPWPLDYELWTTYTGPGT